MVCGEIGPGSGVFLLTAVWYSMLTTPSLSVRLVGIWAGWDS